MRNISRNFLLVQNNSGPSLAVAVSGSEIDQRYWDRHFSFARTNVFKNDGNVDIISTLEKNRKGSFLGVFNAWDDCLEKIKDNNLMVPDITLMSLVFGKGTRMSPFTQAEGNRKSAFWTPIKSGHGEKYLTTADLSNLSINIICCF